LLERGGREEATQEVKNERKGKQGQEKRKTKRREQKG
jgi:hypothetical protein